MLLRCENLNFNRFESRHISAQRFSLSCHLTGDPNAPEKRFSQLKSTLKQIRSKQTALKEKPVRFLHFGALLKLVSNRMTRSWWSVAISTAMNTLAATSALFFRLRECLVALEFSQSDG